MAEPDNTRPAESLDRRTMPQEVELALRPGPLHTSLHPAALPEGHAQFVLNCSIDRGCWEVDKRYRQCQPAPAASPSGFVIGAAKPAKEILAVHNGLAKKVALTAVDAVNGAASQWSSTLTNGSGLTTAAWKGWQYQKWVFIANPDLGVRFMELGTTLLEKLYLNYDLNASGSVSLAIPPYTQRPWTGDTVASGANHTGGDFSIVSEGIQMYDPWDPTGNQLTRHEFILTFAASVDLSKVDYLHFTMTTLQGNQLANVPMFCRLFNSTHTTQATSIGAVVKRAYSADFRTADVWIDLTQISEAERTAVTKLLFQFHLWRDGPDGVHIRPMDLGGIFLQSYLGSKIDPMTNQTAPDIDYAYSYWEPSPTETGATVTTLPGNNTLGERFHPALPYMGSHAKLTVVPFTDPPYNAVGSKVRFYRKVDGLWYRIDDNSVLNTGTPTWTDKRTADEVKALGSPVTLTIGGIDPSASGEVKGIDFGIQWKGANIYFGEGKAFASRVNNFKDVLWDQILSDNAADGDVGRPRTWLAEPVFGQKIIAAVADDALYMLSRTAGSYMTGDLPSSASLPGVLPVRGVVGPGGACGHRGGALICSDDALWFVRVPSGQSANAPVLEEVTANVRPTYAAVIGSITQRALTCIGVIDDEIWVTCENRYLHFTREGTPIYGEFTNGDTVVGIQTNPEYGMIFLLSDGTLGKVGAWKTDGGTDATGSNGAAVSWSWKSRRWVEPLQWLGFRSVYASVGTGQVRGKIWTERNPSTGAAVTFTDVAKTVGFDWYPRDAGHPINGGRWGEIEISGLASDVVYSAVVVTAGAESKFVQAG